MSSVELVHSIVSVDLLRCLKCCDRAGNRVDLSSLIAVKTVSMLAIATLNIIWTL